MKKTNEEILKEIVIIILLFLFITLISRYIFSLYCEDVSLENLHQQQEIIDYHRAEGRELFMN